MQCYQHKILCRYLHHLLLAQCPNLVYDETALSDLLADHNIESLSTLQELNNKTLDTLAAQLGQTLPRAA